MRASKIISGESVSESQIDCFLSNLFSSRPVRKTEAICPVCQSSINSQSGYCGDCQARVLSDEIIFIN